MFVFVYDCTTFELFSNHLKVLFGDLLLLLSWETKKHLDTFEASMVLLNQLGAPNLKVSKGTPPKINMSPKKGSSQKDMNHLPTINFQGTC